MPNVRVKYQGDLVVVYFLIIVIVNLEDVFGHRELFTSWPIHCLSNRVKALSFSLHCLCLCC
jgi:hypothetical protein